MLCPGRKRFVSLIIAAILALSAAPLCRAQQDEISSLKEKITPLVQAGRYGDAIPLARRLVSEAVRVSGPESPLTAHALFVLATILQQQGELSEAKASFEREIAILDKAIGKALGPDYPALAAPLIGLAQIALAQNRLADAERHIVRAIAIQEKAAAGPEDITAATARMTLGDVRYRQVRYAEALEIFSAALEVFRRFPQTRETAAPVALINIGEVLKDQGRLELAGERYREALAILEPRLGRDSPYLAITLSNLGDLYRLQGRLADAEAMARRTLETREKILGPEHPDVATSLINLALVFSEEGRGAEAEGLLRRALLIEEKAFGPDHPDVATALNNLALAISGQGRGKEAVRLYRRTLAIREKSLGPAHPNVAYSLDNLAAAMGAEDRYDGAEPLIRRSLAIREGVFGGVHPLVAKSLSDLAFILENTGRNSEAEPLLKRALELRSSLLGEMHPDTAKSLAELGFYYRDVQDWQAAYRAYNRAAAIWIARGTEKPSEGQSPAGGEIPRDTQPFLGAVVAAYMLSESAAGQKASALRSEAFETAQWTNDGRTENAITGMSARLAAGGGDLSVLVRERQDLDGQLLALDRALIASVSQASERNQEAEGSLRAQALTLTSRRRDLENIIAVRFPEYAALTATNPLPIETVQKLLKPDEALLLFTTSRDFTFVWTITSSGTVWHKAPLGSKRLAENVRVLRCGLDAAAWTGPYASECIAKLKPSGTLSPEDALPFDFAGAYELYKALFGPAETMIQGKKLILVPSGPLATIPFHVLLTEEPSPGLAAQPDGFARAPWLAKRFATSILPSVASLKALRQFAKKSQASRPFIGFGNPLLDGDKTDALDVQRAKQARSRRHCPPPAGRWQAFLQMRGRRTLSILAGGRAEISELKIQSPLPETADELCAVSNSFAPAGGEVRLGADATEAEIKSLNASGRLAEYRILHFATHGALAGQVRGSVEPGLILTPPEQPSALDDGYLTASEIASLKLDADWAVLSACNTAGAERADAEAFSGLARAFFYAGTRALLVSHWAVKSNAAVWLTTGTTYALQQDPKIGRAEALRRSMVSLIESPVPGASHPSFWAAFVVAGEGGL
jgi:CHAT domain-containing protein/tetratricopeptide (TPR) repeat protein